jgi:Zn-dependent peptidase ImmA (M78 family)
MNLDKVRQLGESIAHQYNPDGLSPFPFEHICKDKKDVEIFMTDKLGADISGAIAFLTDKQIFAILVNQHKAPTRQQFTVAHEFGHYFLHRDEIRQELFVDSDSIVDNVAVLFRRDTGESSRLEVEANNFAASLLMPTDLLAKAWEQLQSVDECADVFSVSVEAMSIRLSRLGLRT